MQCLKNLLLDLYFKYDNDKAREAEIGKEMALKSKKLNLSL
ncbi:hypothetical protein bpmyx0001_29230 [Bacillus pseudomycoides DSM 12442]|nr:hypothetical protein bpmyx0001_29230 [Bacillus pseudomycoides DSM 12442]